MELKNLTIKKAHELLKKRETSSVELTRVYLNEIEKQNPELNAFLSIEKDYALVQAAEADKRFAANEETHMLAGIPGAVKDNILVKDLQATAGSKILENYKAAYDATVIEKLKKNHAVFLGKTNLDEFAMGSSTENSAFGPAKNPHDLTRVPGGSSGGSAAAVAGNLAMWSLGTDTGGSIREPASFCGVVGLKTTYDVVSRHGAIALASSLDQIGPMAKTVEDAAIVFEAIAGPDRCDSTDWPHDRYRGISDTSLWRKDLKKLCIGYVKEYFGEGLSSEVERSVRNSLKKLEDLGASVSEISLPHTKYALACYYIILPAEASANLARYDGIRYGFSKIDDGNFMPQLEQLYMNTRGEGFGREVRRRILLGTYVLSAGYYDAYYGRAQKVRRLMKQDFDKAFEKVDVIAGPTSPVLPFKIGEKAQDPLAMYLSDIYTVAINLAGVPAISIPCGWGTSRDGKKLPIGLQLIGKHFDEKTILETANLFEKNQKL